MKIYTILNKKHSFKFLAVVYVLITAIACGTVPEETTITQSDKLFSVEEAFKVVAKENDIARTLYTKAIVGGGKKVGLKFHEDWEKDTLHAGPLPALFLRGISDYIRKTNVPLGLYLGSDFPVVKSNKFTGKQGQLFQEMRKDSSEKVFLDTENSLYTAMFPDYASAPACVSCHNKHEQTMKTDWKMGDIMGATTWTYPKDSVTYAEMKDIIMAYREGAQYMFDRYLTKSASFTDKPSIGEEWPSAGFYLPTSEVFLDSVADLTSKGTLTALLTTDK